MSGRKDEPKEGQAAHPHLTAEFFVWLWFAADREGGTFNLDGIGVVDMWIEDRLSFRVVDEDKARVALSGEDTASSAEARAALASGKVVRDLQLHLRREEREYSVTLRGVHLDLCGLKLPAHASEGEDGLLYERMFLYEEAYAIVSALYRTFARERTSAAWHAETLPQIRAWVQRGEDALTPEEDPDAPSPARRAASPAVDQEEGGGHLDEDEREEGEDDLGESGGLDELETF
jgi:hypothetical protein